MNTIPYNVIENVVRVAFTKNEPFPADKTLWAKRKGTEFSFYVFYDGEWQDVSGAISVPNIDVNLSAFNDDVGFVTIEDFNNYLVSGTSIKTINGQSIVGPGNLVINGGGTGLDSAYEEITISDPISKNSSGYYDLPSTIYETALAAWQTGRIPVLNVDLVSDTTMFSSPLVYINSNFVGYFHKSGANKTHFVCTIGSTSATINVDYEQDKLESGVNIKTINNTSLLGSGDISVYSKPDDGIPLSDLSSFVQGELQDGAEAYSALRGGDLELTENKVISISSSSTDTQYPSAKATYDYVNSVVENVAPVIDLLLVNVGDTLPDYTSKCVLHYSNMPVQRIPCVHDNSLYELVCTYSSTGIYSYYLFIGDTCTAIYNTSDVPSWVSDKFV